MNNSLDITYNETPVKVNMIGTDQKLIPSLLSALRNNKLTLSAVVGNIAEIDLLGSEAMLHCADGNKYRLPIF